MVIKMMRDLMEKGYIKSMIFITHELPLLYNVTDDIMVMYAGQIVEIGTAKEMVFGPPHPYTKGLMGSIIVPEEGVRGKKLAAIPWYTAKPEASTERLPVCRSAASMQHRHAGEWKSRILRRLTDAVHRCLMSEREIRGVYENE